MKNKFRIIDDNTIAIEINFKGSKYDCLIDKEDFDKVASIKTT